MKKDILKLILFLIAVIGASRVDCAAHSSLRAIPKSEVKPEPRSAKEYYEQQPENKGKKWENLTPSEKMNWTRAFEAYKTKKLSSKTETKIGAKAAGPTTEIKVPAKITTAPVATEVKGPVAPAPTKLTTAPVAPTPPKLTTAPKTVTTGKAAVKVEIKEKPEEKPKEKPEEKPEEKPSTSKKLIDWQFVSEKVGPHLKGIPGLPQMVVEYAKFTPQEIEKANEQLFDAIDKADVENLKNAILNGANVNSGKELFRGSVFSPLGFALRSKMKPEIFEILLANNANPDQTGVPGSTSINWLLSGFADNRIHDRDDFNKILNLLLYYGATIEKGDLTHASERVSALPAKMLLDKGADVNEEDAWGVTPIVVATNRGNTEVVKLLLQKGANPNKAGRHFLPPLINAVMNRNLEMIKSLIENGADVNITHSYGDGYMSIPLFGILKNYYPDDKKSEEILQLLLEKGADVNFRPGPKNYSFLEIINQNPEFKRLKEIYEQFEKKKAETKAGAKVEIKEKPEEKPTPENFESSVLTLVKMRIKQGAKKGLEELQEQYGRAYPQAQEMIKKALENIKAGRPAGEGIPTIETKPKGPRRQAPVAPTPKTVSSAGKAATPVPPVATKQPTKQESSASKARAFWQNLEKGKP